jgi:hypothetical protein
MQDNFRKLLRKNQALSQEECNKVLRSALRGTLAVNGENGYPYALPINFFYDEEDAKIYFHSGKVGYKMDCIEKSAKACFTVMDEGIKNEGEWWLTFRSVVIFGKIERIEERDAIEALSRRLSHRFTKDEEYIQKEIDKYAPATAMLALSIENMQGKIVREK